MQHKGVLCWQELLMCYGLTLEPALSIASREPRKPCQFQWFAAGVLAIFRASTLSVSPIRPPLRCKPVVALQGDMTVPVQTAARDERKHANHLGRSKIKQAAEQRDSSSSGYRARCPCT